MNRLVCVVVSMWLFSACWAQPQAGYDRWLKQNYKFVPPPAPGTVAPVTPVVGDLRAIQNTLMRIMWRANFDYDYEAALAAAYQAAANAQLLGAITGQVKPVQPSSVPAPKQPAAQTMDIAVRAPRIESER